MRRWPKAVSYTHLDVYKRQQLRCVLSYFDFFNFAPDVKSRTLVSMSLQDPVATTQQILAIYNHLGGPRQMVVQDTPGHLAVSDREHFYLSLIHISCKWQ